MSERWEVSFWTIFLGFQLAFFPMHMAGLMGMPRRVYTYPAGWARAPNMLSTIGSGVVALAILMFVVNMAGSFWGRASRRTLLARRVARMGNGVATTLVQFCPHPRSRKPNPAVGREEELAVVHGLRVDDRELLMTSVISASPDVREPSATPSIWPFISAWQSQSRSSAPSSVPGPWCSARSRSRSPSPPGSGRSCRDPSRNRRSHDPATGLHRRCDAICRTMPSATGA